MLKTMNVEDNI